MHTIQYIAVQADDREHAHGSVKHYLEEVLGSGDTYSTWFDWFVTGGGRWSTSEGKEYDDNWSGDVVHQSGSKFEEYLDTAHKYRQQELTQYEEEARKVNLTELLDNLQDFEFDHYKVGSQLYPLKQLYEMCMGVWNYNSYYFDIVHDSTNRKYMRESIDKGADNWYLVPVDFHF
jgi:hypothetical protein